MVQRSSSPGTLTMIENLSFLPVQDQSYLNSTTQMTYPLKTRRSRARLAAGTRTARVATSSSSGSNSAVRWHTTRPLVAVVVAQHLARPGPGVGIIVGGGTEPRWSYPDGRGTWRSECWMAVPVPVGSGTQQPGFMIEEDGMKR